MIRSYLKPNFKPKIILTMLQKRMPIIMGIFLLTLTACDSNTTNNGNPLLGDFKTVHNTPPFDQIKREHFSPAVEVAMENTRRIVDGIIDNSAEPTFENTILALEYSNEQLSDINNILFNLNHAETDTVLQKIIREVAPKLTDFGNDIRLNEKLFKRVKAVYDQRDKLNLNTEQSTLLQKTYKGFARNGANLDSASKEQYRAVTRELSELSLRFNENVLAETNSYQLHLTKKDELAGLPESLVKAAAMAAKQKGKEGWVITLDMPIYSAFMKFSERRDLREKIFKAYNSRGFRGNENDNAKLVLRIAELRLQLANLLGYPTFAHYVLEERMAESPEKVTNFLQNLVDASLPQTLKEVEEVKQMALEMGAKHNLEKWDWGFYSEKLKNKKFNFNEEELKPYFKLENVKQGIFALTSTLYGITFKKTDKISVYHPDVETYEVIDGNGKFIAVLYLDFFPREGKSGGAWMTSFRSQYIDQKGKNIRPLISVVTNFTKPTDDTPSLLTFYEFTTFLHEFGHALHGIFANTSYSSLSGTSVFRDFVELPSQIMENWAIEKEFLDMFAIHYQTGEKIPTEKVEAIIASRNFLAGYTSLRQISFGIVDMAWHSLSQPYTGNIIDFELSAMAKTEVLPTIKGAAFSTAFSHIFAGGYAAGYYSYKWAEVLDADAYHMFKTNGIFDKVTAQSFRDNILSKGGTEHPMELYKRFRGQEPTIDALLERSGLKK